MASIVPTAEQAAQAIGAAVRVPREPLLEFEGKSFCTMIAMSEPQQLAELQLTAGSQL
jgi:hypothetical protein